jgi:hypothetical protein
MALCILQTKGLFSRCHMQLANLLCGTEQAFQSALVMKYLQKFFEQLFEKGINTII